MDRRQFLKYLLYGSAAVGVVGCTHVQALNTQTSTANTITPSAADLATHTPIQLSTATPTSLPSPTSKSAKAAKMIGVSAGFHHSLALQDDGSVWAWGYGPAFGLTERRVTHPVKLTLTDVSYISASDIATSCLVKEGVVYFIGAVNPTDTTPIANLANVRRAQATSPDAVCTLDDDGYVWIWTNNPEQILAASIQISANDELVRLLGNTKFVDIDAGAFGVLAISEEKTLWIWGRPTLRTAGLVYETLELYPFLSNVADATVGVGLTAVLTDGTVWQTEELDYSNMQRVNGLVDIIQVSGDIHSGYTVALSAVGEVWVWGKNYGQILCPISSEGEVIVEPQKIAIGNIVSISAGAAHIMALDSEGDVWVWGVNAAGQVGNGGSTEAPVCIPTQIAFR